MLLMVSVNVVNIIRIIMNTQVNGENHKEHTMQFLFLCIYARGWGDHNELNRVFSQCWCCVFNGWGFFFIWFGFRHKICNKIIFQHPFGPTVWLRRLFCVRMTKMCPQKTTDMNMNRYTGTSYNMYIIQSSKVAPESTISAHLIDAILWSI